MIHTESFISPVNSTVYRMTCFFNTKFLQFTENTVKSIQLAKINHFSSLRTENQTVQMQAK